MVSHKSKLIKKINLNLSEYGPCSSDFDLNQDLASSQKLKFLEASVLIPVLTFKEDLEILLTKRSINLRNHPGQIAFPSAPGMGASGVGGTRGPSGPQPSTYTSQPHNLGGGMQKKLNISYKALTKITRLQP